MNIIPILTWLENRYHDTADGNEPKSLVERQVWNANRNICMVVFPLEYM